MGRTTAPPYEALETQRVDAGGFPGKPQRLLFFDEFAMQAIVSEMKVYTTCPAVLLHRQVHAAEQFSPARIWVKGGELRI